MRSPVPMALLALVQLIACAPPDRPAPAGPPTYDLPDQSGPSEDTTPGDPAPVDPAPPVEPPPEDPGVPGEERPALDIAPDLEAVGEHGGPGCPTVAPAEAVVEAGTATTWSFAGVVTGGTGDGAFYVRGRNGEEIAGAIAVRPDGGYDLTVPVFCGESVVKRRFAGATCDDVVVTHVVTEGCVDADIRATLVWDGIGADWELHLVKPGGHINDDATDCTWTSCVSTSPDWGVAGDSGDDPHKDVDDTGTYGPENIWINQPEAGTYTVIVEHWGSSGSPDSDGKLIINLRDKLYVIDIPDLAPHHAFVAATIDWPQAASTRVETSVDCTASWSSGCTMSLP